MARERKTEKRAPCFGQYSAEEDACDPEICADYEDCITETKGQEEEEVVEVDLGTMDRDELLAFAEERDIELVIPDDADDDDIRAAIKDFIEEGPPEEEEEEEEEGLGEEEEVEEEDETEEAEREEGETAGEKEPEVEVGGTGGRRTMRRAAGGGGGGPKVERLADGVIPKALKPFKDALKAEYGSLKEKKSIINVLIDDRQFMGVAKRGSNAGRVMCIVYGSGKWKLPEKVEKRVQRWDDARHNNEIKLVVEASEKSIAANMAIIKALAKTHKQVHAQAAAKAKAEKTEED